MTGGHEGRARGESVYFEGRWCGVVYVGRGTVGANFETGGGDWGTGVQDLYAILGAGRTGDSNSSLAESCIWHLRRPGRRAMRLVVMWQ